MNKIEISLVTTLLGALLYTGCGSSNNSIADIKDDGDANLLVETVIDGTGAFVNLIDGSKAQSTTNSNGLEVSPSAGVYAYNNFVYTTGFQGSDNIRKYSVQDDNSLKLEEEVSIGNGASMPTSLIFVNETKVYLVVVATGELLVLNPNDLTITKRIDLSAYAMGDNDNNPEPSTGVIRGDKLYLGLAQIDSFQTFKPYGRASVLIIDINTDEILKHITDDRTCTTGTIMANNGFVLDEKGDIYVSNKGEYFGSYPELNAGYLRIKNGEDQFDPHYYFSITDLEDLDIEGGKAKFNYQYAYLSNGKLYTTLRIPGLTSTPPDYMKDKNYQPYVLDLYNQTATKVNTPLAAGWSAAVVKYNNKIIYGLATDNGIGLYKAGEQTPYITTDGYPAYLVTYP